MEAATANSLIRRFISDSFRMWWPIIQASATTWEPLLRSWELLIECNVQRRHIHARFAEKAKIRVLRRLGNERLYPVDRNVASFSNSGRLHFRICRTDVPVQA